LFRPAGLQSNQGARKMELGGGEELSSNSGARVNWAAHLHLVLELADSLFLHERRGKLSSLH